MASEATTPMGVPLVSPTSDIIPAIPNSNTNDDRVQMKKQLGLLEGVAIILGIIFGSGKPSSVVKLVLLLKIPPLK